MLHLFSINKFAWSSSGGLLDIFVLIGGSGGGRGGGHLVRAGQCYRCVRLAANILRVEFHCKQLSLQVGIQLLHRNIVARKVGVGLGGVVRLVALLASREGHHLVARRLDQLAPLGVGSFALGMFGGGH